MTSRRVVLLYNPHAGRRSNHRAALIARIAAALRACGCTVEVVTTTGPGSAIAQTQALCVVDPPAIIFACGGDGTVHEVLQGIVFNERTALGIVPLGSANVLARHLRLSRNPLQAALTQLARTPQRAHAGRITYTTPQGTAARYFLVVAGAGPDGALVYRMLASGKHRLGSLLYALRAAKLFLTARFASFDVTTDRHTQRAISAMAVRVDDLGGIFRPLLRNAHHRDDDLLLSIVRGPARPSLLAWFTLSWMRLHRLNRWATLHRTHHAACSAGVDAAVRVEADGEPLGTTPMTLELVHDAVLLLPPP
jgi:diacylglycerol kinase family enzyme